MAASATLLLRVVADTQDASAALRDTAKGADSFASGIQRAAAPAAAALGAIGAAGFAAAQSASALDTAQRRVADVFGDSAAEITAWGDSAATALGLSKQEALSAAGGFGSLFTQLGIGAGTAADMSTSLVGAAADLATYHGVAGGAAEVTDAMAAAMRGEYDSLQRVVPTINAAAVEQRALADTGKTTAGALTDSEKAAATYALILEGAAPAAGTMAEQSGTLAVQQQQAAATAKDVAAAIGSAFVPAMQSLLPLVTAGAKFVQDHSKAVAALAVVIGTGAAAILAINAAMKIYQATQLAIKIATVAWTVAQTALNVAMMLNPVGAVVAAVGLLIAAFVLAYKKIEPFRNLIDAVWQALKTAVQWVGNLIGKLGDLKFPSPPAWLGKLIPGGNAVAATAAAPHAAATATSAPVVVNVTGALDPDAVARQIRRVLAVNDRRTGRAYATAAVPYA